MRCSVRALTTSLVTHALNVTIYAGQHYFVPNPSGQGLSPVWDFTSTGRNSGKKNAYVLAARAGGAPAPTGAQDVDWLVLSSVSGGLAKEVYRTDTREGQPPASVSPFSARKREHQIDIVFSVPLALLPSKSSTLPSTVSKIDICFQSKLGAHG
jgi:hypothetical protein